MPTTGLLRRVAPIDPRKVADPNVNTPPSDATSQYPAPPGAGAIPTTGLLSRRLPVEP